MSDESDDLSEIVEAYCDKHQLHRWDGINGVDNLNILVAAMGYRGNHFTFGSPLETFLIDNPGAIEAILEWIGGTNLSEWREALVKGLESNG